MVFRSLVKDSAVYGGADFLTKILSFFSFPIIAAVLSPKAFGALELIFTVTALFGLVLSCGLNNAIQRFYWDTDTAPVMRPIIVTSGLYTQVAFGIFAVLVGAAAIPFVLPWMIADEWPLTWIALVAVLLVMVLSQWSQYILDVIRLHFAPWRFFFLALTSRVFTMGFGLIALVYMGLGIDGLLTAQALVLVVVLPFGLWMIRMDIRPAAFDWTWHKELVKFGHPFIFVGLAYWLLGSMDRWMLASMSSVAEVGIYSVAFRFASLVLFVSAAFGQAWSPVAIKIRTDHPNHYRQIYGQVLLLLLFVMLVVGGGLSLFSGELINLIMPPEYLPSALPLAILCFGIILQSTQQITAVGISIEKRTYLFARLAWLTALINFTGNWILVPSFGAIGAAWATLISYLILTTSYLYITQKLHPLIVEWRRLILLGGMGATILIVSVLYGENDFNLVHSVGKLVLALVCISIGWVILPIHSLRKIN